MWRHEITIIGIPVPQSRPRFSKGRVYTESKSSAYRDLVRKSADSQFSHSLLDMPLSVDMMVYMPLTAEIKKSKNKLQSALRGDIKPSKKPDIDNLAKAVMDGFNGIVWVDDGLVTDLCVKKRYSDNPRVEVVVEVLKK